MRAVTAICLELNLFLSHARTHTAMFFFSLWECLEKSLYCKTVERQRHVSGKPKSPPARLLMIDKGILPQLCSAINSNSVILGTPPRMLTKSASTSKILTDFLASQASKLVVTSSFPRCKPAISSPCSDLCTSAVNMHVYCSLYVPKLASYSKLHYIWCFLFLKIYQGYDLGNIKHKILGQQFPTWRSGPKFVFVNHWLEILWTKQGN